MKKNLLIIFSIFFSILLILYSILRINNYEIRDIPILIKFSLLSKDVVNHSTSKASISSSNLVIINGENTFSPKLDVQLDSDPDDEKGTLELAWYEHGIEMRLNMYFKRTSDTEWEMYELRTYGNPKMDWYYYKLFNNPIKSKVDTPFYSKLLILRSTEDSSKVVVCKDCKISAFDSANHEVSEYGYSLSIPRDTEKVEPITLPTVLRMGLPVRVYLRDNNNLVVQDQNDFYYRWYSEKPSMVRISSFQSSAIECEYNLDDPCTYWKTLRGLQVGVTNVIVEVRRKSDNVMIASTSIPVIVTNKMQ